MGSNEAGTRHLPYLCAHVGSNEAGTRHLPYFSFCKFDKFEEVTLTNMKDTLRKAKNAL